MPFYLILLVTMLTHVAFKGSKVLISLYAIELGANPLVIGVLFAMYSVFPMFLSVYAGKVSDRFGFRPPMIFGACGLLAGLLLPYFVPGIAALFVSATLIGLCYIFYVVAVQHLIGSFGEGAARTHNYSMFSVMVGLTALLGPTTAGFSIDGIGHRSTYLLLACIPAIPILTLLFLSAYLPRPKHQDTPPPAGRRVTDLLRAPPLRRVLIAAGIMETGSEVVNFLLPIYGHSIGMTASQIGIMLGAYGLALLLVRSVMPALARRLGEERVFGASLFVAGAALVMFPFVSGFPLLLAMSFVLGMGLGCGAPLSLVLVYNRAPDGRSGEAMGLRQTVNKTTEVIVPLLFGSLSTAFGMVPVFWLDALLLACGGWLMWGDARKKQAAAGGRVKT